MSRCRRTAVAALAALGVTLAAAGCTDDSPAPAPGPTSTAVTTPQVDHLTFGVYGARPELDAFRETVEAWNATGKGPDVRLRTWPDRSAMREDLESEQASESTDANDPDDDPHNTDFPDVFLASRSDLAALLAQRQIRPVDELLDERGVDFGDSYTRDALQAFSADDRLQCMPYAVSPMVIYYNTRLVNFRRMRNRGLEAPEPDASGWSFDQFAAAAVFASRPLRGSKGVHIDATLTGLTPFVESGGGSVFDDSTDPTSLTFSSDGSKAALERTLELLRNPQVTLAEDQLVQAAPLTWFERGKLGMIAGFRSLVPELRKVPGLKFDVMPMPVLDSSATVGEDAGLCMWRHTASPAAAADFMVHELSRAAVSRVTRTGYLVPANLQVALTATFLQPGSEPANARFFTSTVRSMTLPPLIDNLPELEAAVEPALEQLVYGVGVLDLDALTQQIDEQSRTVLSPESLSGSPSASQSSEG